jgi:alanine-synthesizing transaminase
VQFSKRTQWDMTETPWARLLAELRAAAPSFYLDGGNSSLDGAKLLDLTASNPTHCGLRYDPSAVLTPLADSRALVYDPNPRGDRGAREAISRYYQDHGITVDPESLLLTTSTSEAYSFLFRLLCDPGDAVLIAQPSYPLFDFLARLDDVRLTPYELFYDHGWHIDVEGLRRQLRTLRKGAGRPRAIVVVHPNNPTGHFTRPDQRQTLENICREHDLALIVDEVFLDYAFREPGESFAAREHDVLTFVLSGLSKVAGLPQMKASWIAAFGQKRQLALERLEVIADTFLSMNAAVQCALPTWLQGRAIIQQQIGERLQTNLATLDAQLAGQTMVTRLDVEGGWYAVLRIPALVPDEQTAMALLSQRRLAIHPGYFFGFPTTGWLVVSLLPEPEEFAQAVAALIEYFS